MTLAPDSELAALIAYLQRLGRGPQPTSAAEAAALAAPPAPAPAPAPADSLAGAAPSGEVR